MNETAIELTRQTLAPLYNLVILLQCDFFICNSVTSKPGVSLAVVFDLLHFNFNLPRNPTFNQAGSSLIALQFIALKFLYLELSTFNRHLVRFRFKLCSPYLYCLLKYIHLNSEWDVKCTKSQILSFVYIFWFLIEKIGRGKKHPVSLLEHIYGSTGFLDQH